MNTGSGYSEYRVKSGIQIRPMGKEVERALTKWCRLFFYYSGLYTCSHEGLETGEKGVTGEVYCATLKAELLYLLGEIPYSCRIMKEYIRVLI